MPRLLQIHKLLPIDFQINRLFFKFMNYKQGCPAVSLLNSVEFFHCSGKQVRLKAQRRSLNHVKLLARLARTGIWTSERLSMRHGRRSHQIKHLNNYCLICCCGRGACGLIRRGTEREAEGGAVRFSLLMVRPPGPQVTLTILETLQTRVE